MDWINVDKQLPKKEVEIFVRNRYGNVYHAKYVGFRMIWHNLNEGIHHHVYECWGCENIVIDDVVEWIYRDKSLHSESE